MRYLHYRTGFPVANSLHQVSPNKTSPMPQVASVPSDTMTDSLKITPTKAPTDTPIASRVPATTCCFAPSRNVSEIFTREYFQKESRLPTPEKYKYNGKEYDDWQTVDKKLFRGIGPDDCVAQWRLTVLEQNHGFYLKRVIMEYQDRGLSVKSPVFGFGYIQDNPELPRILYLGDSITRSAWTRMMKKFGKKANIHGAPTNCLSFQSYKDNLPVWLGSCPWDLIQFNVGMHFHPQNGDDLDSYKSGLEYVLQQLRSLAPEAHVVIAFTTPSPFDSPDTFPDEAKCPHFHKLHKQGYISKLNDVVRQVAATHNVTVNDRYNAVLPKLKKYQNECDVHYNQKGDEVLIASDWKTAAGLLGLS